MSLSSLGAQLASLHSQSGQTPGTSVPSSRRKQQGQAHVGRGLNFSSQHGHAISKKKSSKYRPSVLYETNQSDIPLSLLRERAAEALSQLIVSNPALADYEQLVDLKSRSSERGLLTREHADSLNYDISTILPMLSCMLQEVNSAGNNHRMATLQVVEYLLQRHEIHLYNAQELVLFAIPHVEDHVLFNRVIELVDLALLPTFSFLRAYSGGRVNRTALAKQTAKNSALLKLLAQMVLSTSSSRGGDYVCKVCAAIIVKALTLQVRTKGHLDEASLRVLLPVVLQACASKASIKAFGYIVVSTISEYAQLSSHVLEQLVKALLTKERNLDTETLLLLLSVLPRQIAKNLTGETNTTMFKASVLSESAFELLHRQSDLPQLLYQAHQHAVVAPLVISLVEHSIERHDYAFLTRLFVEEPSLWLDESLQTLLIPVAVALVHQLVEEEGGDRDNGNEEVLRHLMTTLRTMNPEVDTVLAQTVASSYGNGRSNEKSLLLTEVLGLEVTETTLLVPQVALEHADPVIRRDALQKLVGTDTKINDAAAAAIVRHFGTEEETDVILAVGQAVKTLLAKGELQQELLEKLSPILQKHVDKKELVEMTLDLAGYTLQRMHQVTRAETRASHVPLLVTLILYRIIDNLPSKGDMKPIEQIKIPILEGPANAICRGFHGRVVDHANTEVRKLIGGDSRVWQALDAAKDNGLVNPLMMKRALLNMCWISSLDFASIALKAVKALLSLLGKSSIRLDDMETRILVRCVERITEKASSQDIVDIVLEVSTYSANRIVIAISDQVLTAIGSRLHSGGIVTFLEVALRSYARPDGIVRLLKYVSQKLFSDYLEMKTILVPLIALLGSEHYEVRKATLTIFAQSQVSVGDLNELGPLFAIFSGQRGQSCVSSILVDGAKALPQVFRQAMAASSEPKQLRRTILDGCVVSTKSEWLPGAIGSLHAVSVVLTTVELAGEASFPLLDRWTWAGMPILDLIRNDHRLHNADIIETVVRMLKGALVHDSRDLLNMVISQQGRTRSYSVGTNRGLGYIDPFPDEMAKAIVDCLCLKEEQKQTNIGIVRILIREVLCSESWCAAIFKELSPRHRIAIASKLLQMLSTDIMDEANKALLHLPLFGSDLDKLLKDHSADLVALSSLIDHIQSNAPSISSSGDLVKVTASLFSALNIVSSSDYLEDDGGGLEFLRHSMLQALLSLSSCSADAVFVSEELLPGTVNLLVALVGGGDVRSSGDRPLGSWRARKTALSLLTSMGSQKPSSVMKRLLTALVSCINNRVSSREAILSVVPIIHKFSDEANLSLVDIFDPIIKATRQVLDPFLRIELHQGMVFALATTNDEKALGVFLSLLNFERTRPSTDVVLLDLEPTMILRCILVLISFMSQVFDYLTSSERVGDRSLALILDGLDVDNDYERARACVFCQKMGDLIAEILSIKRVEAHLQNSSDSSLVLQLWQSLLILHAEVEDFESTFRDSDYVDEKTRRFMDLCRSCIGQVVDSVHHLLPVPVFLASVSSLIDDKDVGDVRVKALRHLADSASTVECDDPEAALFLELLPSVTAMIREADQDAILLQQGAILVIEQFARSLFSPELELSKDLDGSFMEALQCLVARLIANSKLLESVPVCNRAVIFQLVSSVGLGIATLVQALKTRALPLLATLIEAVLSCLSLVHTVQSSQSTLEPHVQLLRLSMTRALTAIVQCLSQFLIPYLDKILLPSVLTTLRFDGSDFVPIVAESVPPRQLIPAASRALKNCTSIDQFKMVLEVTKLSVLRASQAEISPVKASILLIVLMSCEFEDSMMDLINEVMVAFVMKLSEPQLRAVYAKIRDWRDEAGGSRTFAFWSISAALSRELKSFFLPCVSAVAVDASRDVERAASILSPSNSNSKKRIKVGSVDSLNFLPALVSCLGHAFSADAREGGKWIREDEDKRYYAFMEPLSKLLQARVPSDFPVGTPTKNPYHALIVQDGGVVSCLVSLASAAGNETLWKPLNHAVIEACNNEDHIEIQRAGLTCLLKLIQTLGEEYMILLPECLPVLSELLEADEETAAIARGCVELSEELLGESLEESLR